MMMVEEPEIRLRGSSVMPTSQFEVDEAGLSGPETCRVPFDEVKDSETLSLVWWETLQGSRTAPT